MSNATDGWTQIEKQKTELLKKVAENLSDSDFQVFTHVLQLESEYRHFKKVPSEIVDRMQDFVERTVK